MKPEMASRRFWLLVLLITVGFLALATWQLKNIGLKYSDEGVYLAEAAWLLGQNTQDIGYEPPFVSMKPLYSGLLAVMMRTVGLEDWAAYLLNGLFGAVAVLGVILIGRRVYSAPVGLFAGGLLALMPLHLAFARNALADMALSALLVWTLYAYVRARQSPTAAGRWRGMFAAGLLFGLAYEAKFTAPLFALVLLGLELRWHPKGRGRNARLAVQRWAFLAAGFLAVFAAAVWWYARLGLTYWLYFVQRVDQFAVGRWLLHALGLSTLPRLPSESFVAGEEGLLVNYGRFALNYLNLVALPVLVLALLGIILCLRHRKTHSPLAAIWALGSLIMLLLIAYGVPRTMVYTAPALALAAAVAIEPATRWLGPRIGRPTLSPLWLLGLVLLWAAFGAAHVVAYTNPAPRAAAWQLLDDGLQGAFVNEHFTGFLTHKPAQQIVLREQIIVAHHGLTHVVLYNWKNLKGIEEELWNSCPPFSSVPVVLEDWSYPYRQAAALDWLYAHAGPLRGLVESAHQLLQQIPGREKEIRLYRTDEVRECLQRASA